MGSPLYIASLVFRETLGNTNDDVSDLFFGSVPMCFFTLFRCVVVGECTDNNGRPLFYYIIRFYGWTGWMYAFFYCALVFLMFFGIFNVVVAIYVENVVAAAKSNDHQIR